MFSVAKRGNHKDWSDDEEVAKKASEISHLVSENEMQAATAAMYQLIESKPNDGFVHTLAASLFLKMGDEKSALREIAITLALLPENPVPYKMLAKILEEENFPEIAETMRGLSNRLS